MRNSIKTYEVLLLKLVAMKHGPLFRVELIEIVDTIIIELHRVTVSSFS